MQGRLHVFTASPLPGGSGAPAKGQSEQKAARQRMISLFYPDTPDLPLPPGHRFPAGKYRLLRSALERDGAMSNVRMEPGPPATLPDLERAHDSAYIRAVFEGTLDAAMLRRIGFPWSPILGQRARSVAGGAVAAARSAIATGFSGQLAGGTHHAHRDFGSGFCVFNDCAVAALAMLAERRVDRVAIIDLDVHQGDGNAAILADRPDVFVLSVHGEKNFPFRKVPSNRDVGLPDGTADDDYLAVLAPALEEVMASRPELVIYLSGADPLASDTLGRLSLTHAGLERRDRLVFEACRSRAIPVSVAVGGGYADPISDTVAGYANTFKAGLEIMGR
jgi:acetoin utilization deacetylase AcuC-like enzyme